MRMCVRVSVCAKLSNFGSIKMRFVVGCDREVVPKEQCLDSKALDSSAKLQTANFVGSHQCERSEEEKWYESNEATQVLNAYE